LPEHPVERLLRGIEGNFEPYLAAYAVFKFKWDEKVEIVREIKIIFYLKNILAQNYASLRIAFYGDIVRPAFGKSGQHPGVSFFEEAADGSYGYGVDIGIFEEYPAQVGDFAGVFAGEVGSHAGYGFSSHAAFLHDVFDYDAALAVDRKNNDQRHRYKSQKSDEKNKAEL